MNRRRWSQSLLALLALEGCAAPGAGLYRHAAQLHEPRTSPFRLGIASGEPQARSLILWTRILPEEFSATAPPDQDVMVRWELADDPSFQRILQHGQARALAVRAHCVHVKVQGLQPNRPYFYRFHCGAYTSVTGRARTAPPPEQAIETLNIAFASCQHWEMGHFGAYQDLVAQNPDLVLFLGDYLYEYGPYAGPSQRVRRHDSPLVRTLGQYRARYALYKGDPDLQAAHAVAPWLNIWDDHEVENDYAGILARDRDPQFAARRLMAYQAFLEHMPVDFEARIGAQGMLDTRIYRHLDWGSQIRIHLLDTRQYRDVQACVPPGKGGAFAASGCEARHDPARSLLGHEQERWLRESLRASRARWNIVAQQTLVTSLSVTQEQDPQERIWMDGWDGYLPAKQRLLQALAQPGVRNPIVLGGDVHSEWLCNLRLDPLRPDSPIIASEACGTSITSSAGISQKAAEKAMRENRDVLYGNADRRGYNLLSLGTEVAQLRFRAIEDVRRRDAPVRSLARFVIESGRPGLQAQDPA